MSKRHNFIGFAELLSQKTRVIQQPSYAVHIVPIIFKEIPEELKESCLDEPKEWMTELIKCLLGLIPKGCFKFVVEFDVVSFPLDTFTAVPELGFTPILGQLRKIRVRVLGAVQTRERVWANQVEACSGCRGFYYVFSEGGGPFDEKGVPGVCVVCNSAKVPEMVLDSDLRFEQYAQVQCGLRLTHEGRFANVFYRMRICAEGNLFSGHIQTTNVGDEIDCVGRFEIEQKRREKTVDIEKLLAAKGNPKRKPEKTYGDVVFILESPIQKVQPLHAYFPFWKTKAGLLACERLKTGVQKSRVLLLSLLSLSSFNQSIRGVKIRRVSEETSSKSDSELVEEPRRLAEFGMDLEKPISVLFLGIRREDLEKLGRELIGATRVLCFDRFSQSIKRENLLVNLPVLLIVNHEVFQKKKDLQDLFVKLLNGEDPVSRQVLIWGYTPESDVRGAQVLIQDYDLVIDVGKFKTCIPYGSEDLIFQKTETTEFQIDSGLLLDCQDASEVAGHYFGSCKARALEIILKTTIASHRLLQWSSQAISRLQPLDVLLALDVFLKSAGNLANKVPNQSRNPQIGSESPLFMDCKPDYESHLRELLVSFRAKLKH